LKGNTVSVHDIEAYVGSGIIALPLLQSALDGGVLLASRSPNLVSHERNSRDHSLGVWAGRGACLDALEKRHNSAPYLWLNHVFCVLMPYHTCIVRQRTRLPDFQIILNFKLFLKKEQQTETMAFLE